MLAVSAEGSRLQDQFQQITDENVKKAMSNFRAELNKDQQFFDFNEALASTDGQCYESLIFDGTDIFIKIGSGTIKSSNDAVSKFHRIFGRFDGCLSSTKSSVTEDFKNELEAKMAELIGKHSDELIRKVEDVNLI